MLNRLWEVTGDQHGLTCPGSVPDANGTMICKTLTIPDCMDRTVYCSLPPETTSETSIFLNNNPSPVYKKAAGKSTPDCTQSRYHIQLYIKYVLYS